MTPKSMQTVITALLTAGVISLFGMYYRLVRIENAMDRSHEDAKRLWTAEAWTEKAIQDTRNELSLPGKIGPQYSN